MDTKRIPPPDQLTSAPLGTRASLSALGAPHVVLVVQDDVYARTIERWLSRRAWTVTRAPKASSALPWWRSAATDMVLVDLDADPLSGLALLAAMRRENPASRAIVLTQDATVARLPEAVRRKLGIAEIVVRPCHLDDMVTALGRASAVAADASSSGN